MKIVFTCDLHGRHELYRQTAEYAAAVSADCVLLGGDLLPTRIANPKVLLRAEEEDFQICLLAQIDFIDTFLKPALERMMQDNIGMRIFYIPGNHDWIGAMEHLERAVPGAVNLHGRVLEAGDITFAGYACVTDSTFWVKDYVRKDRMTDSFTSSRFALVSDTGRLRFSLNGEYALRRPSMEEELADLPMPDPGKTVCMFHCPPFDTGLDTLHNGKPIGSRSIRDFITAIQPFVSLHGHIHESPYMSGIVSTRMGECLAVNPGHGPDLLHAVAFDTSDPSGTFTHSVFDKDAPEKGAAERFAEDRMRKIKAFFMNSLLKGR